MFKIAAKGRFKVSTPDFDTQQRISNAIRTELIKQGVHIETISKINFDDIREAVFRAIPDKK